MNVGVDLGTTYSLIARISLDGSPTLIPDYAEESVVHTPSVVHIAHRSAFVGRSVEVLAQQQPDLSAIRFFKRQFGGTEPIHFDADGTPWYPETMAALVLKKLRFDAESCCSTPVKNAVITVPAHFSDPQRRSVLAAAALADIEVLGLVEEPVAAALHYGVTQVSHDQVLVVYDFGGGTFDATVLSLDARGVFVLAKGGLTDVGGKEFDEAIGAMVLEQFEEALGEPIDLNARSLLELRRISEELKIELSSPGQTTVSRTVVIAGEAVEVLILRADFDRRIDELIERTIAVTREVVLEAGLVNDDIDTLLLVGGSSMVPAVKVYIDAAFPDTKILFHQPTRAVAYGAAIHAAQLAGHAQALELPPEFRGVTGYCVGVRTMDPSTGRVVLDTLIKKNMPLPAKARKTYFTTRPNQQRMVLELVQYRDLRNQGRSGSSRGPGGSSTGRSGSNRAEQDDVISLGQMVVGPLPSPQVNYPIEVSIENLEDGTVAVGAYDAQTGIELSQVFGREGQDGLAHLGTQRALVRNTVINQL